MIGLNVAEDLGITELEAKHAFAHDAANKMIANYSPANRPEIFQGALGAPLGLFQSFMINYYERLFRYTESSDYKSLARMMIAQGGLFGVTSLPGWQQFNSFMTKSDGSDDPQNAIWRRFGGNAGDLLAHGLLSNLPELFGLPGADFYSRGDVSIRQFQIKDPDSISGILSSTTPAFNVMQKLYRGIGEGIDLFNSTNPGLNKTQVGEILSNMIANRPLSGAIEQFLAHGDDTDALGQVVSDTKSNMEMAYRLLGIRSQRQSNELQAFYANKNAQSHQAALTEELSVHTRQIIRTVTTTRCRRYSSHTLSRAVILATSAAGSRERMWQRPRLVVSASLSRSRKTRRRWIRCSGFWTLESHSRMMRTLRLRKTPTIYTLRTINRSSNSEAYLLGMAEALWTPRERRL
jgi:hypothetical protein